MKQNKNGGKLKGAEGFEKYYSEIFGDRWPSLKEALLKENCPVEFKAGGKDSYFLDSASIRCAVSLPLNGAKTLLDMCAAPGGKTLVLASCMDESAELLSNERSQDRKLRLVHTVQNCLPASIQERVTVIGKDGATLCLSQNNKFDRILLDAPCSSERHVLLDEKYLSEWSPSRIKTLSMAQWALLSSGWRMLNPGGYLLYSTCALNPDENDNVVKKLLKKFDDAELCQSNAVLDVSAFCDVKFPEAEKTECGFHVLPDSSEGAGPLYFSLLKKI